MDVLSKIGIDWKLLIAQVVNFLILLFVLRRFAYRPMLEFLEKRSKTIDDGLQNAKRATEKLIQLEQQEKEVLERAKKEANLLLSEARATAERTSERIVATSRDEAERLLEEARKKIDAEKGLLRAEMRRELANLVLLATEKVVGEKMKDAKDGVLVKEAVERL